MPRMRLSVRKLMVGVAVLAVLLWSMNAFRRRFAPTPAEWARDEAASVAEWTFGWCPPDLRARAVHNAALQTRRYTEIAHLFEASGEGWDEATLHGPFTDRLEADQAVVVKWPARLVPEEWTGRGRPDVLDSTPIAPGTPCVVLKDWANDSDNCANNRDILVRIQDGPHRGEVGGIDRIYLRRRR